jgi:nicotinamide-nucleotide amidase
MQGEIIAVGSELLLGQIANTNAAYLSRQAALLGVDIFRHTVVGDNKDRLRQLLIEALSRSEVILITGGLGPTKDDITRETIAETLGIPLIEDETSLLHIRQFFQQRGIAMSQNNQKQAMIPQGAVVLRNPSGTAPGFVVEKDGKEIVVLPGPPSELRMMFENSVVPYFKEKCQGEEKVILSRILKFWGIGESKIDEALSDLFEAGSNHSIAYLFQNCEVQVRITAKGKNSNEALRMIAGVEKIIRARIGKYLFGADDDTVAEIVGRELKEQKMKIAVAESCTGGLLGSLITDTPGSSEFFEGGFITYSNDAKQSMVGVSKKTIGEYGPVSQEAAAKMAEGAAKNSGAQIGISITGIAGPGGSEKDKPVGLVYIGLYWKGKTYVEKHLFMGSRERIKYSAAITALHVVRKFLQSGNHF